MPPSDDFLEELLDLVEDFDLSEFLEPIFESGLVCWRMRYSAYSLSFFLK